MQMPPMILTALIVVASITIQSTAKSEGLKMGLIQHSSRYHPFFHHYDLRITFPPIQICSLYGEGLNSKVIYMMLILSSTAKQAAEGQQQTHCSPVWHFKGDRIVGCNFQKFIQINLQYSPIFKWIFQNQMPPGYYLCDSRKRTCREQYIFIIL